MQFAVILAGHLAVVLSLSLAGASVAWTDVVPSELSTLAATARLGGPVVGWCKGNFESGHPDGYAVAVASHEGGGRYLVLRSDAPVADLAAFTGGPDLSCYTLAEALKLDVTIRGSRTIHGQIAPTWSTTVVCGFVENTRAVCWQYSPADRRFVEVGGWVT